MKDDFNNNENNKRGSNKPLQEITDKELAEKVQLYAGVAPDNKERFQVLRFHQNYISLKHSREKNQMARDHWFTQGQRIGLNQDKTLADERSNQDKLLGHSRKTTLSNIKELYHQNYSTTKSFNNEAQNKTDKDTIQQKRKEIGKPVEVYRPDGELDEKSLKAFVNNVIKLAPDEKLKNIPHQFYQNQLKLKESQKDLTKSVESWVKLSEANKWFPDTEIQNGNMLIQGGLEATHQKLDELRNKTKGVVKDFYHQNYSVTKSFNEVGKEKAKDKGLDMDKG